MRRLLLLLLILLTGTTPSVAELSQREWMEQLTDSLGWAYGLPDDPQLADYAALLSGARELLLEAEDNHRRSDRIAVKRQTNLGEFSGSGWVSGRSEPVQLYLDFLVPHNGYFRLAAATRLPGVKIKLADREFVAAGGDQLTYQELGAVELVAGPTEAVVSLPPDAGIDYLLLSAPPRPGIAPLSGWQPEQELRRADLALTMLQALDLLSTLPETGKVERYESESAHPQAGVQKVADRHLGVPSGGQWVRAGGQPTEWQFPVRLSRPGCYQVSVQGSSQAPANISAAGVPEQQLPFGAALAKLSIGDYCFPDGELTLKFQLPPRAGVDSLEFAELDTSIASLTALLGLPGGEAVVDRRIINELLQLLSSLVH